MKEILSNVVFTHYHKVAKVIGLHLEEKLPGFNWQVAEDVGENSYLDSNKWILMKMQNVNYMVFAI